MLTAVYILMSIVTFIRSTPSIGGGIFLLIAAILNIFAQINQTSDANDANDAPKNTNETLISNDA